MGFHIRDRWWVSDKRRQGRRIEVFDYGIDSVADLEDLPDTSEIGGASLALDLSTGDIYGLKTGNWVKLP